MKDIQMFLWLFPSLFIFHDFEEIIFIQAWINKNKHFLATKFPSLVKRLLPHFENITTASFALGVAEEFILITIVTFYAYITKHYNLWLGLFIFFTLHLLMHCFQALAIKRYTPALATSILCLPACIYIVKQVTGLFPLNTVIFYTFIGLIISMINLIIIHKGMDIFSRWLTRYELEDRLDF